MQAREIISLLAARHSRDAFFTEVAINGNQRRMDAWALIPSYTNSLTVMYEVKTTRRDFVQDSKMHKYAAYANESYLVCPADVAKSGELPEGFGLLVPSGNRLMTRKKAAFRDVQIPESFYRALIASKVRHYQGSAVEQEIARRIIGINEFEDYLAGKKLLKDIGYSVSKKLANDIFKFENDERRLANKAEELNSRLDAWKAICEKVNADFGVDLSGLHDTDWDKSRVYSRFLDLFEGPGRKLFELIEQSYNEMLMLRGSTQKEKIQ
jgi:hypothetical protein